MGVVKLHNMVSILNLK